MCVVAFLFLYNYYQTSTFTSYLYYSIKLEIIPMVWVFNKFSQQNNTIRVGIPDLVLKIRDIFFLFL